MSDETLLYLGIGAGLLLFAGTVAMVVAVWKMLASAQRTSERAVGQQASDKGWAFETSSANGSIDRRWTGTTNGVPWRAEYRAISNQVDTYRRHEFRWTAAVAGGPTSPLLLVHRQSALAKLDASRKAMPAFLAKVVDTATDKALDLFFGREAGAKVDLARLQLVDGHGLSDWQLMAQDSTDALLVMERSLKPRLAEHVIRRGAEVPVVLLLPDGVHLALRSPVSTTDLDDVVALGSSLAAAFRRNGQS
jgi:hypothetical protein